MARNLLVATSQHNQTALDVIDGALFVLVIDDVTPTDIHEAAANMHGVVVTTATTAVSHVSVTPHRISLAAVYTIGFYVKTGLVSMLLLVDVVYYCCRRLLSSMWIYIA